MSDIKPQKPGNQGSASVPATQNETQKLSTHKVFDEQIILQVNDYIKQRTEDGLVIPPDYNVTNALVAAKLHLFELKDKEGKLIIDQVTLPSVVNSLTRMVTRGYNIDRKQCSFIKYGNQLVCQPEYFGNLMVAKRDGNVKDVNGHCVYEGDEFVYSVNSETGRMQLIKHEQSIENRVNQKIKGAYAIVVFNDNSTKLEVMNMNEIRAAWNMGAMKGKSPAHDNFTDQMAIKTVENRAVKMEINTADDSEIPGIQNEDPALEHREEEKGKKGNRKQLRTDVPFEDITPVTDPPEATPAIQETPGDTHETPGTTPY